MWAWRLQATSSSYWQLTDEELPQPRPRNVLSLSGRRSVGIRDPPPVRHARAGVTVSGLGSASVISHLIRACFSPSNDPPGTWTPISKRPMAYPVSRLRGVQIATEKRRNPWTKLYPPGLRVRIKLKRRNSGTTATTWLTSEVGRELVPPKLVGSHKAADVDRLGSDRDE